MSTKMFQIYTIQNSTVLLQDTKICTNVEKKNLNLLDTKFQETLPKIKTLLSNFNKKREFKFKLYYLKIWDCKFKLFSSSYTCTTIRSSAFISSSSADSVSKSSSSACSPIPRSRAIPCGRSCLVLVVVEEEVVVEVVVVVEEVVVVVEVLVLEQGLRIGYEVNGS